MTFQDVLHELEEANIIIVKTSMSYDEKLIRVYLERDTILNVVEHDYTDYETPFRREELSYLSFEVTQSDHILCWPDLDNCALDGLVNDLEVIAFSWTTSEFGESVFGQIKLAIKRMLT